MSSRSPQAGSVEDHGESATVMHTDPPAKPEPVPLSPEAQRDLRDAVDRSFMARVVMCALVATCAGGVLALIIFGVGQSEQIVDVVSYGVAPLAGVAGAMAGYYWGWVPRVVARSWLTRTAIVAIIAEVILALIILGVLGSASFRTVKDVLSYGLAPLTVVAGAIATYYYTR